jgi:annexin A7/11
MSLFPVQLCNLLYLWMLDPAERDAIMARDAIERAATDYRVLVEIFTRRKQEQLFFTKQAYMARFKKNLEHDMVTEPSHPYQRVKCLNSCSSLQLRFFYVVMLS